MIKKEQGIMIFLALAIFAFSSLYVSQKTNAHAKSVQNVIHESHLSDAWYSHDPEVLRRTIHDYLAMAQRDFRVVTDPRNVKALIVPHAGHFYSGLCAATAYQSLLEKDQTKNNSIRRVIILAPSHTMYFEGIALPDYTAYQTPLGMITVDQKAVMALAAHRSFLFNGQAHAREHALEIQLPFLQETIDSFSIVPLIVGNITPDSIGIIRAALSSLLDEQTLIVVSSDFMHYGSQFQYTPFGDQIAAAVQYVDSMAIKAITMPSSQDFSEFLCKTGSTICGQNPIKLFLALYEGGDCGNLDAQLASYYTSAQLSQARTNNGIDSSMLLQQPNDDQMTHSVSYVGLVFSSACSRAQEDSLTMYEKKALLVSARRAIKNALASAENQLTEHLLWPPLSPALTMPVGAFVTLNTRDGDLRGCIGQIIPTGPLFKTVIDMAQAAAFRDRRFAQVTASELDSLLLDVTILSPLQKIAGPEEIILGQHGILLKRSMPQTSAVFLPQVPLSFGWTLDETLEHLSVKAGLAPDGWKENCTFEVFEGFEIHE